MTNSDGRLPNGPALEGAALVDGVYEWTFGVGDYFAIAGVPTAGTPFLKEVPIRFGIDNPEKHYHVPLLASPWSSRRTAARERVTASPCGHVVRCEV